MEKEKIISDLSELPSADHPDITILLKKLVINEELSDIEQVMYPMLRETDIDVKIRFYIYYAVSIYYRCYEHHSKFISLVEEYSQDFYDYPLNYVILSLYYKYIALDKNKTELFSFAIENALKAVDLLPQNPGVLNNYSELLVVAVEEGYLVEEDKINDAIKMLQRIINRNPKYAKWHYVQGMLFSYIDKYNEARIAVREAIDLEDATTKDSLIRIAKYNTALLDFRSKESINTIEHSINRAEADLTQMGIQQNEKHEKLLVELDDVKSQYLEFLAFFSSIIAFITASINIVSSYQNFFIASSLIIVFSGCQSLAFCIFRLLINYKGSGFPKINIILSLVFSFLMIALGFFIGWYMGG